MTQVDYTAIIYKTTNIINDKIYIGQSNFNRENYLGSGKMIIRALKKYGTKNFKKEILEFLPCNMQDLLDEKEKYWIKFYNSTNRKTGYNIQYGGNKAGKHSEITKKLFSKIHSGKKLSEEHKRKIGLSSMGRKSTEKQKQTYRLLPNHKISCMIDKKLDRDKLIELYIIKKLNSIEIAKMFNCSPSSVLRRIKKFKIKTRSNTELKKNIIPWNKGMSLSKEMRKNMSIARIKYNMNRGSKK